jgi:hypothetical protein
VRPYFVFCADVHLDDGAWTTRPAIYGDSYYSFDQIVDYCIAHRLPLVLGGDVLERKQNQARPIAKLCAALTRMATAQVPVYFIQGNHEYDRNAPWLSVHPWPIHIHKNSFEAGGYHVYGLDWLPKGEIQTAFEEVPDDVDILVTHQVWKDFMGSLGRTECELTDVHNVRIVLAGDFHVTKTVESVNAQGDSIRMLSPGSTAMQDMGETHEKFFFVIGEEDGDISFKPIPLKTRRAVHFVVKTVEELDDLCATDLARALEECARYAEEQSLPEHIKTPLVRVKFDKSVPDAYLRVVTTVGDAAHLFCEALPARGAAKQSQQKEFCKNDLFTALADMLGDSSPAYALAAAVLSADNPANEIDAQYNSYLTRSKENAASEVDSDQLGSPPETDV